MKVNVGQYEDVHREEKGHVEAAVAKIKRENKRSISTKNDGKIITCPKGVLGQYQNMSFSQHVDPYI